MNRIQTSAMSSAEMAKLVKSAFNSLSRIKNSLGSSANAVIEDRDLAVILIDAKTPPTPEQIRRYESVGSLGSPLGDYMALNKIHLVLEDSSPFSNSVKSYWKITLRPKELIK